MSQRFQGQYCICVKCKAQRAKRRTVKLAFVGRVCRETEACARRARHPDVPPKESSPKG